MSNEICIYYPLLHYAESDGFCVIITLFYAITCLLTPVGMYGVPEKLMWPGLAKHLLSCRAIPRRPQQPASAHLTSSSPYRPALSTVPEEIKY